MAPPPRNDGAASPPDVTLSVPEIRDFERINAEIAQRLDAGATRIVLAGVEGQRLLASRLRGGWTAIVEVDGIAGPELAAGMDAPGLTILARKDVADGAGSGLIAGRIVVRGTAGDSLGYAQRGGIILVLGGAGHRAGLLQSGGVLIVAGEVGRLSGDRQAGGCVLYASGRVGPHRGRGRRGGRMIALPLPPSATIEDQEAVETALQACGAWRTDLDPL